jgi:hypothetical protein
MKTESKKNGPNRNGDRRTHTHNTSPEQDTNGARFFAQRSSRSSSSALAGLAGRSGHVDFVFVVCLVMNIDLCVCVMKESIWRMEKSRFGFSNLGFCLYSCKLSTRTRNPLSHASRPASAHIHPLLPPQAKAGVHPPLLSLSRHLPPRTAKPLNCASPATPSTLCKYSVLSCHSTIYVIPPYAYLPARMHAVSAFQGGGRVPACMHARGRP